MAQMVTMTVSVRGLGPAKFVARVSVPALRLIARVSPSLARRMGDGILRILTRLVMSTSRITAT